MTRARAWVDHRVARRRASDGAHDTTRVRRRRSTNSVRRGAPGLRRSDLRAMRERPVTDAVALARRPGRAPACKSSGPAQTVASVGALVPGSRFLSPIRSTHEEWLFSGVASDRKEKHWAHDGSSAVSASSVPPPNGHFLTGAGPAPRGNQARPRAQRDARVGRAAVSWPRIIARPQMGESERRGFTRVARRGR